MLPKKGVGIEWPRVKASRTVVENPYAIISMDPASSNLCTFSSGSGSEAGHHVNSDWQTSAAAPSYYYMLVYTPQNDH